MKTTNYILPLAAFAAGALLAKSKSEAVSGIKIESVKRINNSPLIRFANFKDGSHINLVQLNKPYANGYSLGISISERGKPQDVSIYKTRGEAEHVFVDLVSKREKQVELINMDTTGNY